MGVGLGLVALIAMSAIAEARIMKYRAGNIVFVDNGRFSPKKLPRHKKVPISAFIFAAIQTADGSHPPALEIVNIDFDRAFAVNAKGLPSCGKQQLENRTTTAAKRVCRQSIVGSGEASVEVAFPDQTPFTAKGPLLFFNGGVRGRTTFLFVHTYVAVPAPTAVVVPVKITRIPHGVYGIHVVARIPRIAGGFGSAKRAKFTIKRRFTFRGKKKSYLSGSCPTKRSHVQVRGQALFADGTNVRLSRVLPCIPKG